MELSISTFGWMHTKGGRDSLTLPLPQKRSAQGA
jgi:hypothetical protein